MSEASAQSTSIIPHAIGPVSTNIQFSDHKIASEIEQGHDIKREVSPEVYWTEPRVDQSHEIIEKADVLQAAPQPISSAQTILLETDKITDMVDVSSTTSIQPVTE